MAPRPLVALVLIAAVAGAAGWWLSEDPRTREPVPVALHRVDHNRYDARGQASEGADTNAVQAGRARCALPCRAVPCPSHAALACLADERVAAPCARRPGKRRRAFARRPRLAVRLREAGYDTGAFVGAFVLDRRFGLREGFDRYDDRVHRDTRVPDRSKPSGRQESRHRRFELARSADYRAARDRISSGFICTTPTRPIVLRPDRFWQDSRPMTAKSPTPMRRSGGSSKG